MSIATRITPAGAGKTLQCSVVDFRHEDHPRRCGENIYAERMTPAQAGSPPQVRGKQASFKIIVAFVRITPAGAGKTLLFCLRSWRRWDHPRRCGENVFKSVGRHFCKGSPPQVRGKRLRSTMEV